MWNQDLFLEELRGLLRIPTEFDAGTAREGAPYGEAIARGLDYIKNIAQKDGFEVREYGGHAIAIIYGNHARRVEAVSHVDVVPAGDGWSVPPYDARIKEGRLYGRGTQDMKTALWLTYAALKELRGEGVSLRRQVRLVIGADEERAMRDIAHYLETDGLPDFAFTPDGMFPLCLGEKGDLVLYIDAPVKSRVRGLSGGTASNVICAECVLDLDVGDIPAAIAYLEKARWKYALSGGTIRIFGKAAHTSAPEFGDNANIKALRLISGALGEEWAGGLLGAFGDMYGKGLGLRKDYPPMGYASVCLNILKLERGRLHGEADLRFPAPLTAGGLAQGVKNALPGFSVRNVYDEPICLHSPENPFVKALLDNYGKSFPEDAAKPYISGGVTYAKAYSNRCVAYGPWRAGYGLPVLAHQADEYIALEPLEELCKLYAGALKALSNCEV
ncbi:MAG: Sapep family Mn(2+)-dependent dipeptidase [Oscillospiraceae bacterium]|jgi:succinyl-diaminopimelate desuccinylase|nr:Sapep family Mn(2+)-dependent dipeptidase [Oscillospiraceae bacterium]